jgi:hypothetical protein
MLSSAPWHLAAFNIREIDTTLFEDVPIDKHPANASAAFMSFPGLCFKLRGTVDGAQLVTNRLLQPLQILFYRGQIHSLPLILAMFNATPRPFLFVLSSMVSQQNRPHQAQPSFARQSIASPEKGASLAARPPSWHWL